jgi:hypothetical protein
MPTTSSAFASIAAFASNFQAIVDGMQNVADQIRPIFFSVAFVLLVFGTMRGFLQNDAQHLFGNILRVVILVTLIGNWQIVAGIVTNAANAFCNLQITANFGILTNNTTTTTTARLDLAQLASSIEQKVSSGTGAPVAPAQSQNGQQNAAAQAEGFWQQVWNYFSNPVGQIQKAGQNVVQNQIISPITHALCEVLYAIFLVALLICDLIVVLMEVLQKCILVFLGLYISVGFAEFSIPSLRGQAEAFFKTYIGVQCWPVGWVFVNIVTIALFKNLVAPNPENPGQLLIAIVYSVPVFLWVVIGHILAPFYTQKLVTRGGAEMQAFVGAMLSAVGGTSGSVYGGVFSFGRSAAGMLGALGQPKNQGRHRPAHSHQPPGDAGGKESSSQAVGAEDWSREASSPVNGLLAKATRFGVWSFGKAWNTSEFGVRTVGNMANTVGALVADASGNRIGPERSFSFPQGRRAPNRSSRRAADYLNYQDNQTEVP